MNNIGCTNVIEYAVVKVDSNKFRKVKLNFYKYAVGEVDSIKRNVFERNKLKTGIFKQHVVNDTPIHLQIIETTL